MVAVLELSPRVRDDLFLGRLYVSANVCATDGAQFRLMDIL
jgi:hypothetical protein